MSLATQIIALKMQIDQLKAKRDRIIAYRDAPDLTKLVWLADYPKDEGAPIVGQIVGTIELDREDNGDNINIYPAFSDEHLYDSARDGILTPTQVTNPFWAYFNVAVSPGIQKWYPRYRHAEISDIDYTAKTCTINIDPLYAASGTSGEDPLFINQDAETLYNVPIDYMDCTTPPFENFDKVLVMFTDLDWNQPMVKGYQTNPQPCSPDELVFFALGELGIIWDITENAYPTDFVGVQDYSDCLNYLAGKTETTMIDPYFGLPYSRLLLTFCKLADYSDNGRETITTWGLPEQSSAVGYLYDKPQISNTVIGPIGSLYERRILWEETITPWGTIIPPYMDNYFWINGPFGPVHQPGGTNLYQFSSWDYMFTYYVCPLDYDPAYYSFGTAAEYGNDAIGMGYPGAVISENSIVQVLFSAHANTETVGTPGSLSKIYTSPRETKAACTCGTYPWDDGGGGEESNPQAQEINTEFTQAVYDLVEALHVLRGVTIMKDSPDYEGVTCPGPDSETENCKNELCNYWWQIINPKMELKLYRK